MSQDNPTPKLVRHFLLQITAEQAQRINEYRWTARKPTQTDAVRALLDLGLEAAEAAKARPAER
jgi:hypothetical protein